MKKTSVIGICGQSVFLECNELPKKGESILAKNIHIEPGGKGTNAADTITRLGGNVSFLVSVGDDEYGLKCKEFFKEENINSTCITKHGKTDYGLIMCDSYGNNCVSVYMDENVRLESIDILNFEKEIKSSDYILLTGELSNELLLRISSLSTEDTKIIFDPSPIRNYPMEFLNKVWLFTPNELEYQNLIKLLNPSRVVVTLGDKGAKFIENGNIKEFKTEIVKVVNTTGAGDVFNGALCYSLMSDNSLDEAIKFALKAATYKVTHNYVIEGIPTLSNLK